MRSAEWQNTSIIADADMQELKARGDHGVPVLVGAGKRFFENGTRTTLKQVGVEQFPRGVMALTYVPSTLRHSNRAVRRGPPAEESSPTMGARRGAGSYGAKFNDPSLLCNREAVG